MTLLQSLQWRYATKKFDSTKKLSEAQLHDLLETLRLAPSSYGLQPWQFVVVTDPTLRAELQKNSWNQAQVTEASHLIVLCARATLTAEDVDAYVQSIAEQRKMSVDQLSSYRDMMMGPVRRLTDEQKLQWNKNQVYIALGMLLLACAQMQVDACPMEGFDAAAYDRLLGLTQQGFTAAAVCPVGYRSADDDYAGRSKVRYPASRVIKTVG
jgi:nitroreductase